MINKNKIYSAIKYLMTGFMAIIVVYPVYLVLINAVKQEKEIYTNFTGVPEKIIISNFTEAWVRGGFGVYYKNSIIITGVALIFTLIFALLLSYVMTRQDMFFKKIIFIALIIGITVPPQVAASAIFLEIDALGLYNTLLGVVLVIIAYRIPFTSYIVFGYFKNIPMEIEEAAIIDGCSHLKLLLTIFIPLSKPIIVSALIFNFVYIWNNFFFPLLLVSSNDLKTLAVGLLQFKGQYQSAFTTMFAGIMIISVPSIILYFALQKHFIKGMTAGAVKG